jgi:type 1 glutamine amidotransferase
VVRRPEPTQLALAERRLVEAARNHFEVLPTQDCAEITADKLAGYAAVVFYTTGELPVDEGSLQALFDYVRNGGGFVGIHSATDTFYEVAEYGRMLGGYFDGHPWNMEVGVRVEDPSHPSTAHLDASFRMADEIYQFRNWERDRVQVLLSVERDSVDLSLGKRADGDYALSWTRSYGDGRVFHTGLGHRPELWSDPRFMNHLLAGIRWSMDAKGQLSLAPDGARVLFDGNNVGTFQGRDGGNAEWKIAGNALEVDPGKGDIMTRESFRDFRLHVEFRVTEDDRQGQARGNGGVYLQRRYEVQILESFGQPPSRTGCGALYSFKAPDVNASRPPNTWQTFDILFRAARFGSEGKTDNARITVWHNGVLIHDDAALENKTGQGEPEGPEPGPILLQDHGSPVQFRNLWILPLR